MALVSHDAAMRFNDGKCSPDGRLFVGSMKKHDPRNKDGQLYRLDPGADQLTAVVPGVTISNGLVWSLDKSVCYYIDTPDMCVYAFDYNCATGDLTNRRTVIVIPAETGTWDCPLSLSLSLPRFVSLSQTCLHLDLSPPPPQPPLALPLALLPLGVCLTVDFHRQVIRTA